MCARRFFFYVRVTIFSMEPEQANDSQNPEESMVMLQSIEVEKRPSQLTTVTPLSKYLALVLFIILPFVGGWIGYQYAPEKVVKSKKIVLVEPEAFPPLDWAGTTMSQFSSSGETIDFYSDLIERNKGTIQVQFKADTNQQSINAMIDSNDNINRAENISFVPHWHPDGPYKYYELEYGTNYRRPTQLQLQRDLDIFAASDFIEEIERGYGNGNYPRESHQRYHFLIRHNLDSLEAFESLLSEIAPEWTVVPRRLLEYESRSYPTGNHYLPSDYSGEEWIERDTGDGEVGYLNPSHFMEENQVVVIYGLKEELKSLNDFYDSKNEDVTFVRFHKDNVSPDLDASIARVGFKDSLDFNPIDYLEEKLPGFIPREDIRQQPGPLVSRRMDLVVLPGTEIETAKQLRLSSLVQDASFFRRSDFPGGLNDDIYTNIEVVKSDEGYSFIDNRLVVAFEEGVSFDEMISFFIDNNLKVKGRITGLDFWLVETDGVESEKLAEYAMSLNENNPSAMVTLDVLSELR